MKTILTTDYDFDNFGNVGNVKYCWQCCYFIVTLLIEGSLPGGILIQLTKRHISSQKKKLLKAKISDRLLWQFFSDSFARGFDLNLSEDAELSFTLNPKYLTIVSLMILFTFSPKIFLLPWQCLNSIKSSFPLSLCFSKCKICKSFRWCWENAHKSA